MNLEEILLGGGGVLLVAMTLIQVAPIKVNPWSAIAKAIGRAINGEVIAKVDQLERDLEAMKAAQEERDAISCRSRILHFGDETIHGVRHTKEHFDQILRDITSYERYCDDHPHFENNTTVLTSQRIKDIYEDLRAKGPEIKLGRDHAFANFVEAILPSTRLPVFPVTHPEKQRLYLRLTESVYTFIFSAALFAIMAA